MPQRFQHIIEEAIKGTPQAQSKLMDLFWNDVKGYILIKTKNENTAEELTVETFTKAISKLHLYNEDFNFKTWLISIAHNNVIDYFRKKQKGNVDFIDDFELIITEKEPSPEDLLILEQDQKQLEKFFLKLDPKYSEILQLRFLEDLSIKAIADKLNLSESNVKVRILRGKKLLSELYKS